MAEKKQKLIIKDRILSLTSAVYRVCFFLSENTVSDKIKSRTANIFDQTLFLIDNNSYLDENSDIDAIACSLKENILALESFFDLAFQLSNFGLLKSGNLTLKKENFLILKKAYNEFFNEIEKFLEKEKTMDLLIEPTQIFLERKDDKKLNNLNLNSDILGDIVSINLKNKNNGRFESEKSNSAKKINSKKEIGFKMADSEGESKKDILANMAGMISSRKTITEAGEWKEKNLTVEELIGKVNFSENKKTLTKLKKIINILLTREGETLSGLTRRLKCAERTTLRCLDLLSSSEIISKQKRNRTMIYSLKESFVQ